MDARETWQALQARLTAAHAAVDAGDRERALAEITAALNIDPDFLAAHSLRDRILAPEERSATTLPPRDLRCSGEPRRSSQDDKAASEGRPLVSYDGYAKFEQRAKRRRVDRRLDAARAALNSGRLKAAATALDEVIELDPNLPDLAALTAQFDDLRRTSATAHRGPRLAAGAVFVVTVLGASWLQDSTSLISRRMIASSPLVTPPAPAITTSSEVIAVGTTGEREPANEVAPGVERSNLRGATVLPSPPGDADAIETGLQAEPAAPAIRPVALHEPATVAPIATPTLPPAADLPDDNVLVKQTLQRYRSAYEGLDAQSAQAVWPAVNQPALARAFDGLESQTLTFDTCDVRVRGESATATCQGSARYVPKIGSREPRIEPRVWNFTLHKNSGDWKIDSARAER